MQSDPTDHQDTAEAKRQRPSGALRGWDFGLAPIAEWLENDWLIEAMEQAKRQRSLHR